MFKDIAYIIRSPLYFACIAAGYWSVTDFDVLGPKLLFIFRLFIIPFLGLLVCYLVDRFCRKFWKARSWNHLPAETKYEAVVTWCAICTLPTSTFLSYPIRSLLFGLAFFIWIQLSNAALSGGLGNLFEETIIFKESVLSISLTVWVITIAAVSRFGFVIGVISGLGIILAFPFLLMLAMFIIQKAYRLIDHEFFTLNENGKTIINKKVKLKSPGQIGLDLEIDVLMSKPDHSSLAKAVLESIKSLSEIHDDVAEYDFDNNKSGLASTYARYERWKRDTHTFILQQIGVEEASNFGKLENTHEMSDSNVNFKTVNAEVNKFLPYLKQLAKAINTGKVEITTKIMQHKRYRVLHKLFELTPNDKAGVVLIMELARVLDLSFRELSDILDYWEKKGLIESTENTVKLTPFGIDEIEETITNPEKPTRHFPANIVNNYSINIGGANYGAIQQGGENNTQTNTVYIDSAVNDSVIKLLELIKGSTLNDLDKEEIVNDIKRVEDLAKREQTPEVTDRAKKKLEIIKSTLEVTKDAGGLAIKAAPYLATLWQFFTKINS